VAADAEGTTLVAFKIDVDGNVRGTLVAKTSGNADLDNAAVQCAGTWKYRPATHNGLPVEFSWQANVQWRLHDGTRAEMIARACEKFLSSHPDLPQTQPRVTGVTFRVMPDGSTSDVKIAQSSGDNILDDAAARCTAASRFPTAMLDWPQGGVAGHETLDWGSVLWLSPPTNPSSDSGPAHSSVQVPASGLPSSLPK
jgi:TonB family protein